MLKVLSTRRLSTQTLKGTVSASVIRTVLVNYSLTALSITLIIALSALIDSINYSTIILRTHQEKLRGAYQKHLDPIELVAAISACGAHLREKIRCAKKAVQALILT